MSTAIKFPAEKNASFTRFHGAKQTGPANTPFYRLHVLDGRSSYKNDAKSKKFAIFIREHATLQPALSVGRSVGRFVGRLVTTWSR